MIESVESQIQVTEGSRIELAEGENGSRIKVVEKEVTEKEEELIEGEVVAVEKKDELVPWFLRVKTPQPTSHPFAHRQELPELPDDPPEALEPLLKHLSEELGINDISLIDLRSMDPPPAIGADTIMIIGNARSERHLHISADKICRWLRSEWKMAPYADGLLGRNELKIKNRRLKKKGKLINTETGAQDGVGWICVDVGSQGLVLQLFTPHRREEIDLEGLWGRYLRKGGAHKGSSKVVSIEEMFGSKPVEDVEVKYSPPIPVVRLGAGLSTGSEYSRVQKRSFHTSPGRRMALEIQPPGKLQRSIYIDGIGFGDIDPRQAAEKGKYWRLTYRLPPTYSPNLYSEISELIVRAKINHLKLAYSGLNSFSRTLCNLLGDGPADTSSTTFLRDFYHNLPPQSTIKRFQFLLELLIEGHRVQPQQYPANCLLSYFNTLLAANIIIPPEFYYLVLRAFADSPPLRFTTSQEEGTARRLELMAEVKHHMKEHCPQTRIDSPEIQYCFFRALAPPKVDLVHMVAMTVCSQDLIHAKRPIDHVINKYKFRIGDYTLDHRLHDIDARLASRNHSYTLREYQETLLVTYAMGGCWVAFWNCWKRLRYLGVHRDVDLYKLVIGLLVMAKNQNEAVYAARHFPNSMIRELPPIGMTRGVPRGFLGLLDIAEGGVERLDEKTMCEFKELRKRCKTAIKKAKTRAAVADAEEAEKI